MRKDEKRGRKEVRTEKEGYERRERPSSFPPPGKCEKGYRSLSDVMVALWDKTMSF